MEAGERGAGKTVTVTNLKIHVGSEQSETHNMKYAVIYVIRLKCCGVDIVRFSHNQISESI